LDSHHRALEDGIDGAFLHFLQPCTTGWKFTADRPEATVEFGVTRENGTPTYFVRDNGAGFDMTYANKLFEPFQRLHRADEFEGTGIGLATVQRVIHRHGGRIWAEGAVDQGATIFFTLSSMGEQS